MEDLLSHLRITIEIEAYRLVPCCGIPGRRRRDEIIAKHR